MTTFRNPGWETPEIDDKAIDTESSDKSDATSYSGCTPAVCAPEPGVWTWGTPVPSPSLDKPEGTKTDAFSAGKSRTATRDR